MISNASYVRFLEIILKYEDGVAESLTSGLRRFKHTWASRSRHVIALRMGLVQC